MLFGVNSPLFVYNSSYQLTKRIQVLHLTPSCLANFLEFFMDLGSLLKKIDSISENLKTDICMTYQYFADGCIDYLCQTRSELISIKEEFSVQSGNTTRDSIKRIPYNTITLISLKQRLYPFLDLSRLIFAIIQKSIISENYSISYKASYMLTYLYILIQENNEISDHQGMSLAVNLFIKSIQPYIKFLCTWISTGSLNSISEEFMIYQKSKKNMGNFDAWNNAFDINLQEIDGRITRCVPDFLKEIYNEILTAGKNMMIIKQIEEFLLDKMIQPQYHENLEDKVTRNLYERTAHCLSNIPNEERCNVSTVSWQPKSSYFYELNQDSPTPLFKLYQSQPPAHMFSPIKCNLPAHEITVSSQEIYPLKPVNA